MLFMVTGLLFSAAVEWSVLSSVLRPVADTRSPMPFARFVLDSVGGIQIFFVRDERVFVRAFDIGSYWRCFCANWDVPQWK